MTEADSFFEKLGWTKLGDSDDVSIYSTTYAVVGLTAAESSETVLARWQDWQSSLFTLKSSRAVSRKIDLYLVILLEEEAVEALKALQHIVDDTHVCRKIVLSRRGRTVARTLLDTAVFQMAANAASAAEDAELSEGDLTADVLSDLAKKSSSAIFDHLLAGKYIASPKK